MAKYTTCWVALTDAMPDNSCLYVIPSKFDMFNGTGWLTNYNSQSVFSIDFGVGEVDFSQLV